MNCRISRKVSRSWHWNCQSYFDSRWTNWFSSISYVPFPRSDVVGSRRLRWVQPSHTFFSLYIYFSVLSSNSLHLGWNSVAVIRYCRYINQFKQKKFCGFLYSSLWYQCYSEQLTSTLSVKLVAHLWPLIVTTIGVTAVVTILMALSATISGGQCYHYWQSLAEVVVSSAGAPRSG